MLKEIRTKCSKIKTQLPEICFLADVFLMCNLNELNSGHWQLDFYNPDTKKIESFRIDKKTPEIAEHSDAFKEPEAIILPLDLKKVTLDFKEALESAKFGLEKYPDSPNKIIAILQNLNNITTWNISFITKNFFLYNSKINAEAGTIIKETYSSLLSFKAQ